MRVPQALPGGRGHDREPQRDGARRRRKRALSSSVSSPLALAAASVSQGPRDRGRGRLTDRTAFLADQKHHRIAAVVIVPAGDERVAAFDAVRKSLLAQEIQRAIDRDRRRPGATHRKFIDEFIGAERGVAREQRFKHAAARRRQPFLARRTDRLGMRNSIAGAPVMVMARRREYRVTVCFMRQFPIHLHTQV